MRRDSVASAFVMSCLGSLALVLAEGAQTPPPAAPGAAPPESAQWVVSLQPTDIRLGLSGAAKDVGGPDVPVNAAHVLETLRRYRLLPTEAVTVSPGDSVCAIVTAKINFPGGCVPALLRMVARLNPGAGDLSRLTPGETLRIPALQFEKSSSTKVYAAANPVDQVSKRDDMKVGAPYKREERKLSEHFDSVTFDEYRLHFTTKTELTETFLEALLARPGIFLLADTRPTSAKPPYHSAQNPAPGEHFSALCSGQAAGEEFPYATLLGSDGPLELPACTGNRCPDIVLLDRPVAPHPEIAAALVEPEMPPDPGTAIACLPPSRWNERAHHGTHLAGLVASLANGKAFAGVHPGARVVSREWESLKQIGTIDLLQGRIAKPRRQIVLFASDWEIGPPLARESLLHRRENKLKDPLAKAVSDASNILWIVAAGQSEETGSANEDVGLEVPDLYNRSPVNLGDFRNVIGVTGCTNCAGRAALWPRGNYSPRYVHVAAPAEPIPSTASATEFAAAGGTSQAAALVAGLASALITRWPDHYVDPATVKQRLQYTARPGLSSEDNERIAGGIVDARVAMLDPGRDYANTTRDQDDELKPVDLVGWCAETFTLGRIGNERYSLLEHHAEVRTSDVFRIVQNPDPADRRSWIVFKEPAWGGGQARPGVVVKVPPAVPKVSDASGTAAQPLLNAITAQPILKTGTGFIRIGEIQDLLVRKRELPVVSCR